MQEFGGLEQFLERKKESLVKNLRASWKLPPMEEVHEEDSFVKSLTDSADTESKDHYVHFHQ